MDNNWKTIIRSINGSLELSKTSLAIIFFIVNQICIATGNTDLIHNEKY